MIKIIYPYNNGLAPSKEIFNKKYFDKIKSKINGEINDLDLLLNKIPYNGIKLNCEKIITADFVELVEIFELIDKNKERKKICEYFNKGKDSVYISAQGDISNFFMGQNMALKTCYYCNIDHINVFEERYQYFNVRDFIDQAPKEVLIFKGISEKHAKKIISNRKDDSVFDRLKEFFTSKVYKNFEDKIVNELDGIDLDNIIIKKNHFTLDHFLSKTDFPYLALSLYNLVPSCSSCNCKFKGSLEFLPNDKLINLSPTSDKFTLCEDLEFKLFFNVSGEKLIKKIENVNLIDDFSVEIIDKNKNTGFETYLNMFKLRGRYEFHKKIVLNTISKRKSYPDSQMIEFSNTFINKGINKDLESIKKDLFGTSIFNEDEKNDSFAKYNKDIARQLGIIN